MRILYDYCYSRTGSTTVAVGDTEEITIVAVVRNVYQNDAKSLTVVNTGVDVTLNSVNVIAVKM